MSERNSQPRTYERNTDERERMHDLLSSLETDVSAAIESGDFDMLRKLRSAIISILEDAGEPLVAEPASDTSGHPAPEPAEALLPAKPEGPDDPAEEYAAVQPDQGAITLTVLDEAETWPDHTVEIGGSTIRVERTEAERVFEKVEIRGDGHAGTLTPELLEQAGLLPHHRLEAKGRTMWFSRGYDLGGGRVAVTGYVQDDDGSVVARSYYRSNSQGVWRYLPQYSVDEGKVTWYSKGYGEESVTLPASLQEGLTRSLEDDGGILSLEKDVAQTAFTGTARTTGSEGTVYHRNVAAYPRQLSGVPETDSFGELPSPETVQPNHEQSPDFTSRLGSWRQDTTLYGRVHYDVYPSNDGRLKYVFCRDVKGRAWISSIENNSPLESTGLHEEWFSGGALTTPAYEYGRQAGSYGNDGDSKGNYVDMFKNYLSKIPVVQEYASREIHG